MPGEHDASLDQGKASRSTSARRITRSTTRESTSPVLDNVSDAQAAIGDAQLDWLLADLKPLPADAPIVVFTHRPLFDLARSGTGHQDGSKAIDLLQHWKNVTVFYGTSIRSTTSAPAPSRTRAQSLIFRCLRRSRNRSAPRCRGIRASAARPRLPRVSVDESRLVLTPRRLARGRAAAGAAERSY